MRLILGVLILLTTFGCKRIGEPEVILLPKNFSGSIIIFFNHEKGNSEKFEGGKRIFEIPKNGVLRTKFIYLDDWAELPEFYYEKIDVRNKLKTHFKLEDLPADSIVALLGPSGSTKIMESSNKIWFTLYYVGNRNQIIEAKRASESMNILSLY